MNLKQNVNIHNRFDVHVDNVETGEHKEYTGYNIILNQMWSRLCNGQSYFANIHFGTGTGTPIGTRTSLFTHLGTKSAITEEAIKAFPISRIKRKIVLNPEEYVGQNIREVGISFDSSTASLVTHAMLKDAEGNPISILKKNTDVITIFATVFVTFDMSNPNLIFEPPVTNSLVNYLVGLSSAPTGSFGLNEMLSSFARLGSTASVTWLADVPNKKRKMSIPRFGISDANGHAQVVDFTSLFQLKLPATGIFSGEPYSNVGLGLGNGLKTLFNLPSRNIKNSSLVVKKNGVVVSNYTVQNKPSLLDVKIPNVPNNGQSVSLNADGTVLVMGSTSVSPYLKVWDWTGSTWTERPQPANIPANGQSVSLSSDGTVLAIGSAATAPYLKVWDWTGSTWTERPQPTNIPANGQSVSLSSDGTVLAMGSASVSPYLKVWDWSGTAWTEKPQPANIPIYGQSVSLSSDGTVLAIGSANKAPYLKVWDWSGTAWTEKPQPANIPTNGQSVSLSADGTALVMGSTTVAPCIKVWTNKESYTTDILFDTAPAVSDVITADYIVNGIHKTDQRVVDVSFAIQFGEGV